MPLNRNNMNTNGHDVVPGLRVEATVASFGAVTGTAINQLLFAVLKRVIALPANPNRISFSYIPQYQRGPCPVTGGARLIFDGRSGNESPTSTTRRLDLDWWHARIAT